MASPLSVLLVEDDEQDAFLAQKHLSRIGADSVVVSPTLKQAQQQIESRKFEIILCDLNLPDSIGVETVKNLVQCARETPVVVLTGSDDALLGADLVAEGAQDFLAKARIDTDRLNDIINHALARQKLWVDAQRAGLYDALTGLPNRALFQSHLDNALENAKRRNERVLVAYLDLDSFKPVNDAFGHAAGDELLCEVARRINQQTRKSDLVARLGGDELALVMPTMTDLAQTLCRIENLVRIVGEPYRLQSLHSEVDIDISVSIGISIYPDHSDRADMICAYADHAMYRAKQLGGGCVQVFESQAVGQPCPQLSESRQLDKRSQPRDRAIKVLLIEDEAQDKQLIEHAVQPSQGRLELHWVQTLKEAIAAARSERFDLILLDLNLPDSTGLDSLHRILKLVPKLPVIVLTQVESDALGADAIRAGAQDFITKQLPELHGWLRVAGYAIERHRLMRDAVQSAQRARLANVDHLTGLANRREFIATLENALATRELDHEGFFIVILDLVQFSTINDRLGYLVGDQVLQTIGSRLKDAFDQDCNVARLGGDEFAVLIAGNRDVTDLKRQLGEVQALLARTVMIDQRQLRVGARMGLARCPEHGRSASALMHAADTALRRAKHNGDRPIVGYTLEMGLASQARSATEAMLRSTLHEGGMHLVFQPIVDARSGDLAKMEALLRWRDPEQGLLTPFHFISVAEDTGLIIHIDHLILREVCRLCSHWLPAARERWSALTINVNVSPVTLNQTNYAETAAWLIDEYGLTDNKPTIEFTETALSLNSNHAMEQVHRLQQLGFRTALDDFGTEYSSLSYLRTLHVDEIKIDMDFVRNIPGHRKDTVLVECIVDMASRLGVGVVIEGIENDLQREMFREQDNVCLQGYLMDRPLELAALAASYDIPAAGPATVR